jgi:hypothetical protein
MRPAFPRRLSAALLAVTLAACVRGQTPAVSANELSEPVLARLADLRALSDAKHHAAALAVIDPLLAAAPAESYDRAVLLQIRVQVLVALGRHAEALTDLENAYTLGERHAFFEPRAQLETLYFMAQLHHQFGFGAKDAAAQKAHLEQARLRIAEWLRRTPSPTADARLLAATIIYAQATADGGAVDPALLQAARREAEQSLRLEAKPRETAYVFLAAVHQQLGEHAAAAEILELLVEQHPASAQYWQQLAAVYLGLAEQARTDADTRRYKLLALLTLERARDRGLLDSPRDRLTAVGLLFHLRRFDQAVDHLENGLASGRLENTRQNWELLASAQQQRHRPGLAVAALERAIAVLPRDGQLEFALGQLHYSLDQVEAARRHFEAAVGKDGLERPGQTHFTLAYLAYEAKQLDEAARWIAAAARFNDVKTEDVSRLARAVQDARAARSADNPLNL